MNDRRLPSGSDVSVIVAAYNATATLDATLASVAAQSAVPGQVVVVDDSSTDSTAAVARRWASVLPVNVIRLTQNEGPSAARNRAVDATTSPLIAVLDADDVWLPDHLASLLLEYRDVHSLVSANAVEWNPGYGLPITSYQHRFPIPPPDRQPAEIVRRNFVFGAALFSRHAFDEVGGYRPEFRCAEDWDLWIRMIRMGCRVRASHPVTYLYRKGLGTLSTTHAAYEASVRVLVTAEREATEPVDRRRIRGALLEHRARLELFMAYECARRGEPGARRHAAKALRGPRAVAFRAAAMLTVPRQMTRRRDVMVAAER